MGHLEPELSNSVSARYAATTFRYVTEVLLTFVTSVEFSVRSSRSSRSPGSRWFARSPV